MPHRTLSSSTLMRPFVVLALPGMYLLYKYNQYRQQQMETARRRVTERELMHLNHKIDKLLNKLEENEPELATSQEDECVICVNAKATMQTSPCGHRVVCRRCFVKTIQMAVSQRLLPLRCVICRAKILRLRHTGSPAVGGTTGRLVSSKSWQISGPVSSSSSSNGRWGMAGSISCYSVGARSVPNSASLYSMTSGSSSLSGVSSVSSASDASMGGAARPCGGGAGGRVCGGAGCSGACLGAVPRQPRQPASAALRRSQHHSMKIRLQDYQVQNCPTEPTCGVGRLPPIREFQRDYREGKKDARVNHITHANGVASTSTRIRCAQKIVTQLETSPTKKPQHFFRPPLKTLNNNDGSVTKLKSKLHEDNKEVVIVKRKELPKQINKKEEKKKKEEDHGNKQEERIKKDESENKKNEVAEKKKEEKLKLKAEKEAKKEAKKAAKEEERQAKLLAKEEKKRAKKESKQNEKDKK